MEKITNIQLEGLPSIELPVPVEVTEEELNANARGLYMYIMAKSFNLKIKELEEKIK